MGRFRSRSRWLGQSRSQRRNPPKPSKVPPLERIRRVLPPADLAALQLGASVEICQFVRIQQMRHNDLELWVSIGGAPWVQIGVWHSSKIPMEFVVATKTHRGWTYSGVTTMGDHETLEEARERTERRQQLSLLEKSHQPDPPTAR